MMCSIGGGVWVLGWLYWLCLSNFAANLTFRIKKEYLEAILKQECAWFDQINYTELSAKIARETATINKGYSEKAGNVSLAIGTFLSGIAVGFWMGWKLALAMMVLVPFVGVLGYMFEKMMSSSTSAQLRFYSQSAGYAEQALIAIRVVVAFGMEQVEAHNYMKHLGRAKKNSLKTHFCNAIMLGLMFVMIYCMYAYAFWAASIFVERQIENEGRNRPYQGGDSIGVFFAVLIGLFSISMISNQATAIV